MRWLLASTVIALAGTSASTSASPSNPAFLGITFTAVPQRPGGLVEEVRPDGAAARAGLREQDIILYVDGNLVDANTLNAFIITHDPGDRIRLDVERNGQMLTLYPTLRSRAEVFDHLIGRPFPDAKVPIADEHSAPIELGHPSSHATVVAWYAPGGGGSCEDQLVVIADIAARVGTRAPGVSALAVTIGGARDLVVDRKRLSTPIATTSEDAFKQVAMQECARVFAMVVDRRGKVAFLAPVSDGDDEDAAIDEVAAAAAQAEHAL